MGDFHSWVPYAKESTFKYCELCGCGSIDAPQECRGAKTLRVGTEVRAMIPPKPKEKRKWK